IGVSPQWNIEAEKGKAGAPRGLVLRTPGALGIALDAHQETPPSPQGKNKSHGVDTYVDIDATVAGARKERKGPKN
ncbi:MAG TPA: hypothetical protein VMG63_08960, partial [Terriglobia bacterium]|nr:hypothetical protein [Terriglobia bacterium]